VESHPCSSIFHTWEWLEALRKTYHFTPTAFTTDPPGALLTNAIVFCRVNSWLTGSKLVSLPFSDHCEPLVQGGAGLVELLSAIKEITAGKFKYVEVRARSLDLRDQADLRPSRRHCLHVLDLRPDIAELYSGLHKDSIRRKVRRAEREHLVLDQGRSELLLRQFYGLLLLTRRRHRIPPQPFSWFRHLVACLGNRLTIHMARVDGRPIASILTLCHKRTVVYKYGCSDSRYHPLGGMPRLFWKVIHEAKSEKFQDFDLGRSDPSNVGLIRFKDHLGAATTSVQNWQLAGNGMSAKSDVANSPLLQSLLPHLPDTLFRLAGEIFYRHAG
jgi:hypothetical protein